jgi:hypothetical protein
VLEGEEQQAYEAQAYLAYVKQVSEAVTKHNSAYRKFKLLFPVVYGRTYRPESSAIEVVQEGCTSTIQGQQGNADFGVSSDSVRSVAANSPSIESQADQQNVNQYHIGEEEEVCRGSSNGTNASKQEVSEECETESFGVDTFSQTSAESTSFDHPAHTNAGPEEAESTEDSAAEDVFVAVVKNTSQDLSEGTAEQCPGKYPRYVRNDTHFLCRCNHGYYSQTEQAKRSGIC